MKKHILAILVVSIFILAPLSNGSANVVVIEDNTIEFDYYTNRGNRLREITALYIQEALRPLGIQLNIHTDPFDRFVGNLLHLNDGPSFDLAGIAFSGGSAFDPSFMWKFHSTQTSFGQSMYQLDNPTWQTYQEQDVGLTTAEIDGLLESIDFELDRQLRVQNTQTFDQLFFGSLLYDYPLMSPVEMVSVHKGFTNNTHSYNPKYNLFDSIKMGYNWSSNPIYRQDNADSQTLQIQTFTPNLPILFDQYQSFDTGTDHLTEALTEPLLNFDYLGNPHPGLAYQWFMEDVTFDHDNDPGTPDELVENGKHTFMIDPTKWNFENTFDYLGNPIPADPVDAKDIGLVLEMMDNYLTSVRDKELFSTVVNWNIKTTVHADDTIEIFLSDTSIEDPVNLGALTALPDHILGGDLNVDDPFQSGLQPNGTIINLETTDFNVDQFNPQDTVEWQHWASESGMTHAGLMTLFDNQIMTSGYNEYVVRSDYPFPTEVDVEAKYNSSKPAFEALLASTNTAGWRTNNLSTFAPHDNLVDGSSHFWTYADDPATSLLEKPNFSPINRVIYRNAGTHVNAKSVFEEGAIDKMVISDLGSTAVDEHISNPSYDVYQIQPIAGPELLVFDLTNEHLQKYNVRKAISMAIDKNFLASLPEFLRTPADSAIWQSYNQYYDPSNTFDPGYDLQVAMDLMTSEGYTVYPDYQLNLQGISFGEYTGVVDNGVKDSLDTDYQIDMTYQTVGDNFSEFDVVRSDGENRQLTFAYYLLGLLSFIAIARIVKYAKN